MKSALMLAGLAALLGCKQEREESTPVERTEAEAGKLVVHGKVWPGMAISLRYAYHTTGDIPECRTSNWPVSESTERGAGASVKGRADSQGKYRLELDIQAPEDGGQCQWILHGAEMEFERDGTKVAYLTMGAEVIVKADRPTALTVECYRHADGVFGCTKGNSFRLNLLPFDAQGRRELTFNIEEVEPPAPVQELVPLDQIVGSPAYNERIRREQEAAESLMSAPPE